MGVFVFKIDSSYNEMKNHIDGHRKPNRVLFIYPKADKKANPIYLVSDIDLFPNTEISSIERLFIHPVEQDEFTELCFHLAPYTLEGDFTLIGLDKSDEEPPILGNLN